MEMSVAELCKQRMGRELSRMSPEIRATHYALEKFFLWHFGGGRVMGMSSRNIIARLMEEGVTAAAQAGALVPQEMPAQYKDVKDAINALPEIRRKAIIFYYTENVPIETVAARLNQGIPRTRHIIAEGRQRVASFLSGRGWRLLPD
jgi:hypothetical protein